QGLRHQIQGAVLQGISRSLFEAVKFDRSHVTSLDWRSYPVLTFADVPQIETVLIDQRDIEPSGAGELATVPVAAALCNAIYDATGVRLRQIPFTPDRIRNALGSPDLPRDPLENPRQGQLSDGCCPMFNVLVSTTKRPNERLTQ